MLLQRLRPYTACMETTHCRAARDHTLWGTIHTAGVYIHCRGPHTHNPSTAGVYIHRRGLCTLQGTKHTVLTQALHHGDYSGDSTVHTMQGTTYSIYNAGDHTQCRDYSMYSLLTNGQPYHCRHINKAT